MYLAAVIDWHSKAILAYKISNSMDATLATDVLEEALAKYPKPQIFNSDQGSQYTSYEHNCKKRSKSDTHDTSVRTVMTEMIRTRCYIKSIIEKVVKPALHLFEALYLQMYV